MSDVILASDAPAPVGPYSQGVRCADLVFLAGQGPFDPQTGAIPTLFEAQVRQVLTNLAAVARAASGSLADAVRVGVYLRNMDDFPAMNRVYEEFFSPPYPARTTVQSLMNISIEIDAVLDLRRSTTRSG
jgi:2-iminobutanoate/2-iminopropanoate deaminase